MPLLSLVFDLVPVGLSGLLGLIGAVLIVHPPHQSVGQILLLHPVVGEVVGVEIPLLPLKACAVGVDILQVAGEVPGLARPHIRHGGIDGVMARVGLGGGGHEDGGIRQG